VALGELPELTAQRRRDQVISTQRMSGRHRSIRGIEEI